MDISTKNIELSTEFSKYIFEHPELEKSIPEDATIVLLPDYDKELYENNLTLGKEKEKNGEKVFYVRIKQIRPRSISRIEGISIGI